MEDIINKINEALSEEFEIDIETITPEANLQETLDIDSLDYVDIVVIIESITGVKLGEQDFKNVANFNDFYNVIQKKMH